MTSVWFPYKVVTVPDALFGGSTWNCGISPDFLPDSTVPNFPREQNSAIVTLAKTL